MERPESGCGSPFRLVAYNRGLFRVKLTPAVVDPKREVLTVPTGSPIGGGIQAGQQKIDEGFERGSAVVKE